MKNNNDVKQALDRVIAISRVHFYKPIQIAEILYRHRIEKGWNLADLESYRNASKRWRDDASVLLVGRRSTSSQKFQDNLFEGNAVPPRILAQLGEINKKGKGIVEAYIYRLIKNKLSSVREAEHYVKNATTKEAKPESFTLKRFVSLFQETPGLKRSVDKMCEIAVYALFSTIVAALKTEVTLAVRNEDKDILRDFERFIKAVLGIDAKQTKLTTPAALYRVGVANAADRGLDMWANFGPAVQVKHLTLTPETVEDIAEGISADKIVIVCLKAEKGPIEALLKQVGWGARIQDIITLEDLSAWYTLCLGERYRAKLGAPLLGYLAREFDAEFPSSEQIEPFMSERGYNKIELPPEWAEA